MINAINMVKESTGFIFETSARATQVIAYKVHKIFISTRNKMVNAFVFAHEAIRIVGTFIHTKTNHTVDYLSTIIFRKSTNPNLPKFKKINYLSPLKSLVALQTFSELDVSKLSLADTKELWTSWNLEKLND